MYLVRRVPSPVWTGSVKGGGSVSNGESAKAKVPGHADRRRNAVICREADHNQLIERSPVQIGF